MSSRASGTRGRRPSWTTGYDFWASMEVDKGKNKDFFFFFTPPEFRMCTCPLFLFAAIDYVMLQPSARRARLQSEHAAEIKQNHSRGTQVIATESSTANLERNTAFITFSSIWVDWIQKRDVRACSRMKDDKGQSRWNL